MLRGSRNRHRRSRQGAAPLLQHLRQVWTGARTKGRRGRHRYHLRRLCWRQRRRFRRWMKSLMFRVLRGFCMITMPSNLVRVYAFLSHSGPNACMHARTRARTHTHTTQYRRAVRESRPQVGSAGDRTARLVCGACGDGPSLSSGAGARKLPPSPPLAHSMMTPLPLYS